MLKPYDKWMLKKLKVPRGHFFTTWFSRGDSSIQFSYIIFTVNSIEIGEKVELFKILLICKNVQF